MGSSGITYSGIATLNIHLGSGGNNFYLQGNYVGTLTNLNLGSGTNHLAVGTQAALTPGTPDAAGDALDTGSTLSNLLGIINVTGAGSDSMNVDDTGYGQSRNGQLNPASILYYETAPSSPYLTINFTGFISMTISLGSGGDNTFLVQDTFTLTPPAGQQNPASAIVINGDTGDANFAIYNTHAFVTIYGGVGNDNFYVFGNSQILNLNGDLDFSSNNGNQGNDNFYIFASLVVTQDQTTSIAGGVNTQAVYDYRMNAEVNINGGSGNTTLFVFATVLDDVITISGENITGAGLNVSYTHIRNLVVESLSGTDTFYIKSISIPTTCIGGGSLPNFPAGIPVPNLNGQPTQLVALPTISNGQTIVDAQGDVLGILSLTIGAPNQQTETITVPVGNYGSPNALAAAILSLINKTPLAGDFTVYYDSTTNSIMMAVVPSPLYNDTFYIGWQGANQPGSLAGIDAPLTIEGEAPLPGNPQWVVTAYVLDNGATGNQNYTLTSNTLWSSEMGSSSIQGAGGTTYNFTGLIIYNNIPNQNYSQLPGQTNTTPQNYYISNLNVYLGVGSNTFNIQSTNATTLTTLYTGDASIGGSFTATSVNTINFGSLAPSTGGIVDNIQGPVVVVGDGNDVMNVDDTGSNSSKTGYLTSTTLTGLNMVNAPLTYNNAQITYGTGGVTYYGINYTGLAALHIYLGTGSNTFNVQSTNATTLNTITTDAGNNSAVINTINIGNPLVNTTNEIVDNIQGPLVIIGDSSDVVNVYDTGSISQKVGYLTSTSLTGLNMVNNPLTYQNVTYYGINYVGLAAMNIYLGTGSNTLNITSTQVHTLYTIVTDSGATAQTQNTINIGSSSPNLGGIVDNIQGPIVLVGDSNDTLNVIDNGSTGAKTGVLTNNTLVGLAMVAVPIIYNGITYTGISYSGLSLLNVYLGSGGNTFTVNSTWPTTHTNINLQKNSTGDLTTITTLSGVDYINIGSTAPILGGIVDYIQGPVKVLGDEASM